MKQELHVCLCHDDGYLKFAAVLMNSIVLNAESISPQKKEKYKFVFHLLCDKLSKQSTEQLMIIEKALNSHFPCSIIFHQVDDSVFKKYKSWDSDGKISYATYLRLLIPEILPDTDKCVYLDCDMLCYGDLTELFEIDLRNKIIAASPDERALMRKLHFKGKKLNKDFWHEYGAEECYFNAGLLVINLKKWRKENITAKCIDYLNRYDVKFPDQDVLNMILFDQVQFIPITWNFNTEIREVLQQRKSNLAGKSDYLKKIIQPVIENQTLKVNVYHYYGQPKPWWSVPFYFIRGSLSYIDENYLQPYVDTACKTPVFGEYFISHLKNIPQESPIKVFRDYSLQLDKFLTIQYNRLKKKHKKIKKILIALVVVHLIEISALIYLYLR